MKVVTAKKNEPRCAVCKSGRRTDVDGYLQRYLNDEPDDGGAKITWPRLAGITGILVGDPITERSIRRHLDGHCHITDEERAEELVAQADKGDEEREKLLVELDTLLESGLVSATGVLEIHIRAHLIDLRQRLAAGERIQLTADQAQRAAAGLVAAERKGQEAQILTALTGGIARAFGGAIAKEIPAGDAPEVIDVEATEVEDDDEAA